MWPCADGVSEDIFEDVWDYKICFLIINKIYFIYIIRYVWKIKGRDLWHLVQLWQDSAHRCLSCQSESLPQVSHCDLVPKFSARQRRHSLSESGYQHGSACNTRLAEGSLRGCDYTIWCHYDQEYSGEECWVLDFIAVNAGRFTCEWADSCAMLLSQHTVS